jgi:hypothetical protein
MQCSSSFFAIYRYEFYSAFSYTSPPEPLLQDNHTGIPYDLSKMYIGTVHSLCQRLIADRRFYPLRRRSAVPSLLDELAQYFYVSNNRKWAALTRASGLEDQVHQKINSLFSGNTSLSKYAAVTSSMTLFNRLAEECIDPEIATHQTIEPVLQAMLAMYATYKDSLHTGRGVNLTDFSCFLSDVVPRGAHEKLESMPVEDGEASVKKSRGMSHRTLSFFYGETPGSRKAK